MKFVWKISTLMLFCFSIPAHGYDATSDEQAQALSDKSDPQPLHHHRNLLEILNTELKPPTRTCDQEVGYIALSEIQEFATLYVNLLLAEQGQEAINFFLNNILSALKFGVKARVICASCEDARRDSKLVDKREFNKFCGKRTFGSDIQTSGLVIYPVNPDQSSVAGSLKSYVSMHSFTTGKQRTPSEIFPESDLMAPFEGLSGQELFNAVFVFYDIIAPLFAASSGAVSVLPDYQGYGQSFEESRLFFQLNYYKQAATAMWWRARYAVLEDSNGYQMIDPCVANTGGFSEGGAAAFAAAQALQEGMRVDVGVTTMGAPLMDLPTTITDAFRELRYGTSTSPVLPLIFPASAHSFSSQNPDLPNSNIGQDALSPQFQDPSNFLTDVDAWMQSEQDLFSYLAIIELATGGDATAVASENVIKIFEAAIDADRISEVCDEGKFALDGETDLFCEALKLQNIKEAVNDEENILLQFCHSQEDDTVPEELNRPDFSKENVVPFNFGGLAATGDHVTSGFLCLYGTILPFTDGFGHEIDTNSVQRFSDPFKCSERKGKKGEKGKKGDGW